MSAEPRRYHVTPGSELSRLLETADREPVILENRGVRYRVVPEGDDIWTGYDPDAVIAGMNAAVGSIPVEEGDRIKNLIYEAREKGTRSLSRA